jgi:hypothetical protein
VKEWLYLRTCPKCRVPIYWCTDEPSEFLGKKVEGNGTCHRCWRRKIVYLAVPVGCLHIWEERHMR